MTDLYKNYNTIIKLKPSEIQSNKTTNSAFKNGFGLIMFYSHTCPHCVNAVDEWVALSKMIDIPVGAFNCAQSEAHQTASSQLNISSVPTIKMTDNGTFKNYEGSRNNSDIIEHLCKTADKKFCKQQGGGGKSRKYCDGGSSQRGGTVKKCKATTKSGKKCGYKVAKGRKFYCNIHGR